MEFLPSLFPSSRSLIMNKSLLSTLLLLFLTSCSGSAHLFRENAKGTYELLSDPSVHFSIDNTGSMAGTPETQMFFYQGISDTEAIYTKKSDGTKYYVPIKLDGIILYYNTPQKSSHNVSFENMLPYAKKIS